MLTVAAHTMLDAALGARHPDGRELGDGGEDEAVRVRAARAYVMPKRKRTGVILADLGADPVGDVMPIARTVLESTRGTTPRADRCRTENSPGPAKRRDRPLCGHDTT